jgi:hypothetical protein
MRRSLCRKELWDEYDGTERWIFRTDKPDIKHRWAAPGISCGATSLLSCVHPHATSIRSQRHGLPRSAYTAVGPTLCHHHPTTNEWEPCSHTSRRKPCSISLLRSILESHKVWSFTQLKLLPHRCCRKIEIECSQIAPLLYELLYLEPSASNPHQEMYICGW